MAAKGHIQPGAPASRRRVAEHQQSELVGETPALPGLWNASICVRTCIETMNDECAKVLLPLLGGEGRGEGGIAVHGSWKASFRYRACIETMNAECAKALLPLLGGEGRAFAAPKRLRPRRRGEGGIAVHGSWRNGFSVGSEGASPQQPGAYSSCGISHSPWLGGGRDSCPQGNNK